MKLIIAIINNDDSVNASAALNNGGFFVTQLSTTGGFLMVGNTTLLICTEDKDVDKAKEIIEKTCATRKHVVTTRNSFGRGLDSVKMPNEVTVGGATVFVLNVDETVKF